MNQERCTAKSKQSGERCKRYPTVGRRTCRMHGGTNPGGQIKHGRYMKHLPEILRSAYEASKAAGPVDSEELLHKLEAIVLRIGALAGDEDGVAFRARALAMWRDARGGDTDAFLALGGLLERGARELDALDDLFGKADKLLARVQKRSELQLNAKAVVNGEALVAIMGGLVDEIRSFLPPEQAEPLVRRIGARLEGPNRQRSA